MNVSLTSLSNSGAALAAMQLSAKTAKAADEAKVDKTADDAGSNSSSTSSSGSSGDPPAVVAQKKLEAIQKGMIALMLIKDPVERAKAAARMYKAYAAVAKEYAANTADGRAAAQAQSDANAKANAQTQAQADGQPQAAPGDAQDGATAQASSPAMFIAPASAKPTFVKDEVMEEIKTFAEGAKMVYDLAMQEAKLQAHPDKSKLKHIADQFTDAKKELDEAAKAVEGDPDGVSNGYTAAGQATTSATKSVFEATA